MEEIKLDSRSPQTIEFSLEKSRQALVGGGVIAFPTDTIYGLGANAFDEEAILKVYRIKERNINKPLSILVRDISMAKKVACIDSRAEKILEKLWPDSVTVILRKKDILPYALTGGEENVAMRISGNLFVKSLFSQIDFPITATSANIAGEPDLLTADAIKEKFSCRENSPDLFINSGDLDNHLPSTIIDLTDVNNPRLVRMGMVSKDKLSAFFKKFE
ncbi:MAG: L-threonylcarbamoyladenylate synthase [Candidatus Pacebacteria bacterium]|jgi:L-threonylcarbamoyladenylate synthase|nr:L-threonylcarbamoyladenylate synthase [Candidatus Paceibacterota bacterium]